MFYVRLDK